MKKPVVHKIEPGLERKGHPCGLPAIYACAVLWKNVTCKKCLRTKEAK